MKFVGGEKLSSETCWWYWQHISVQFSNSKIDRNVLQNYLESTVFFTKESQRIADFQVILHIIPSAGADAMHMMTGEMSKEESREEKEKGITNDVVNKKYMN